MNPKVYVPAVLALLVATQAFVACGHKEEMDRKKPASSRGTDPEANAKNAKPLPPAQAAVESANLKAVDLAGSDACTAPFEFTAPKAEEDHSLKTLVDKKGGHWQLESVQVWRQVKNLDTGKISVIAATGAGAMDNVENIETPLNEGQVLCHTSKTTDDGEIFARIALPNSINRNDGAIEFFRRTAAYAENNTVRVGNVVFQQPSNASVYNLNEAPPGQAVSVASRIDVSSETKRTLRMKMSRLITGDTQSTFLLQAVYVAVPTGDAATAEEKPGPSIPSH